MAGDKTYITDGQGKLHRATRVHAVTPTDIVWSSNPNDYTVQVKIDGKWHRAVLTMDAGSSTFFDNINIDKALVTGADGKQHTALIVKPESTVTLSDIKTDTHGTIAGTTTGETAVSTYSENWSDVKWQDNVNVYKVLVTGSDGKVHTALLTTSAGGGVQVIVLGTSPLLLPDAIADSLTYVKAFGGTEQSNLPIGYTQQQYIYMMAGSYLLTDIVPTYDCKVEMDFQTTSLLSSSVHLLGGRTETFGGLFFVKTSAGVFMVDAFGNTSDERYFSSVTAQNNTRYKFTYNNQVATLESGGTTLFTNTSTGTLANGAALCINGLNTNGSITTTNTGIYLYSFKVWNGQGELVIDLVPAIQQGTVPVVGFYDTVTGGFRGPSAGTFAAGGAAVPTPDVPIDIMSNNGVLKVRHQSGLPWGYTLLEYIESTGTQYINTGINGSQITRFVVKGTCTPNDSSNSQLLGGTSASASTFFGARVISGVINWYCVDGTKRLGNPTHLSIIDCAIESASSQPGTLTDTTTGTTQAFTKLAGDNWGFGSANLLLFGGDATRRSTNATCCYLQLYTSGGLAFSGVPCRRNSDKVVGMYDLVSGQFFTNQGTGDFVAGATVDDVEVYTDGTVETINAHGKNLFDIDSCIANTFVNNTGTVNSSTSWKCSGFIPVSPNTAYVFTVDTTSGATAKHCFYAQEQTESFISYIDSGSQTFTTPPNARYMRISVRKESAQAQLELGTTATTYAPYYNGGTATAEMLLKVGDYQDVQSILDGVVTRNVGVKVLDGTENWNLGSSSERPFYLNNSIDGSYALPNTPFCTHFQGVASTVASLDMPDLTIRCGYVDYEKSLYIKYKGLYSSGVAAFKQFLADQYAAGTPVIIVYPLATPTTESVTGQTLQVTDGDNTLEITQASLTGLELEAQYIKVV